MNENNFLGTDLDEVLEDHEFTADEVPATARQKLPKHVDEAAQVHAGAHRARLALIRDRAHALGLAK